MRIRKPSAWVVSLSPINAEFPLTDRKEYVIVSTSKQKAEQVALEEHEGIAMEVVKVEKYFRDIIISL